jgi:cob(I)alamin adenosyltransferase
MTGAKTPSPTAVLQYINRLSDLLFALARLANRNAGVSEATWQG